MKELLEGKVAVVTGSGSGIGAAVTQSFLKSGVSVVATGRRMKKLERLGRHERLELIAGDVTEPDFAGDLLDTAISRFGKCDIVVNNAGGMWAGASHEIDIEHVISMVRVNSAHEVHFPNYSLDLGFNIFLHVLIKTVGQYAFNCFSGLNGCREFTNRHNF